jgi:hypothetical protein
MLKETSLSEYPRHAVCRGQTALIRNLFRARAHLDAKGGTRGNPRNCAMIRIRIYATFPDLHRLANSPARQIKLTDQASSETMASSPSATVSAPPADRYLSEFGPLRHAADPYAPPPPGATSLGAVELARIAHYEAYQTYWLRGFTLRELRAAGCYDKAAAKSSDLDEPIHPLHARGRWKRGDVDIDWTALGGDSTRGGKWDMQNDVVWEVMGPALRLASLLLMSSSLWSW